MLTALFSAALFHLLRLSSYPSSPGTSMTEPSSVCLSNSRRAATSCSVTGLRLVVAGRLLQHQALGFSGKETTLSDREASIEPILNTFSLGGLRVEKCKQVGGSKVRKVRGNKLVKHRIFRNQSSERWDGDDDKKESWKWKYILRTNLVVVVRHGIDPLLLFSQV